MSFRVPSFVSPTSAFTERTDSFPGWASVYSTAPAIPSAIFFTPADGAAVTVHASATISWAEEPAAGTTIASQATTAPMGTP